MENQEKDTVCVLEILQGVVSTAVLNIFIFVEMYRYKCSDTILKGLRSGYRADLYEGYFFTGFG
jgi:hypothetical protein